MATLWTYDLETKHGGIDAGHREVVEALSRLLAAIDERSASAVRAALDGFAARVAMHFEYEERLFEGHCYAQERDHKVAHRSFVAELGRARQQLDRHRVNEDLRRWAHCRLHAWFRLHIMAYDVGLARSRARSVSACRCASAPSAPRDERRAGAEIY